jgi:NADPH:quinone reductase-like Zn-dependent oxidoreductase
MTQRTRAWRVNGAGEPADVLQLVEVDLPEPRPGQARIRVTAAGIGLPDVFMCRGTYPLTPPLPFTPGQEATGVVTAVGQGVDLPIGTRIMCVTAFTEGNGSFAEESRTSPGGSGWSTGAESAPATGWLCSGPRVEAASPPCSSGGPGTPA